MKASYLVVAVLAFGLVLLHGERRDGRAGEAELGAELLEKGERAFKSKDYALAAACFDEAYAYSTEYVGALYQAAKAYEKADDDPAALVAYRRFIRAYDERAGSGTLPKALMSCRRSAASRAKSLGKAAVALEELREKHAEELIAFAETNRKAAPDVALRALERALDLRVECEDLKTRIGALRGRVDTPPDRVKSPFEKEVVVWQNMIELETLGEAEQWSYTDLGMRLEGKGGGIALRRGEVLESGPRYVYEVEARIKRADSANASMGLVFGRGADLTYIAVHSPRSVQINTLRGTTARVLGGLNRAYPDREAWHRLSVKVDGKSLEGWFDGERFFAKNGDELPGRLSGNYGLYACDCLVEIRELRMGVLK